MNIRCFIYRIALLSMLSITQISLVSAQNLRLAITAVDGLSSVDNTGIYDPLFKALLKTDLVQSAEILPPNRARATYNQGKADCLFPVTEQSAKRFEFNLKEHVLSNAVSNTSGFLLFTDNHPALDEPSRISEDKVGVIGIYNLLDNPYGEFEKVRIDSYEKMIALMDVGRLSIGYFIFPDVLSKPEVHQFFAERKVNSRLIWRSADRFLCHSSKAAIVEAFFQKVDALKPDLLPPELLD